MNQDKHKKHTMTLRHILHTQRKSINTKLETIVSQTKHFKSLSKNKHRKTQNKRKQTQISDNTIEFILCWPFPDALKCGLYAQWYFIGENEFFVSGYELEIASMLRMEAVSTSHLST